jgi:hypothetical protein
MDPVKVPEGIFAYRLEIVVVDIGHFLAIVIVILTMLAVCLLADGLNKPLWFLIVPFLGGGVEGLVIRMDTIIHRLGRFLHWLGDPREAFKAADPVTNLVPHGDVFCLLIALVLVGYAEYRAWQYLRQFHWSLSFYYLFLTVAILLAGGYYAQKAATSGKAPLPSNAEIMKHLPEQPH